MLLDEPASGLSRGERERLVELLDALPPTLTLLLIEHDMDVALNVAERVVVMADGSMVASGTPDEIRHDPLVHEIYLGRRRTMTAPIRAEAGATARAPDGRRAARRVRQGAGPRRGLVLHGHEAVCDHRAQRHGQDDPVQRDHGTVDPPAGTIALRRHRI